ncbi:MAG: 4-hydroxybenzoate octaprenyltransferase [Arsenophonus sp.]|nr:MAG: 4-hydroxybenzoate octaprenyltransferase [Arsenophonus sp.]
MNDCIDKNIDKHIPRTKKRPLVIKKIKIKNALILYLFLIFLSFFLVLQLNRMSIFLSLISLSLMILYPYTKRITYFPQIILGCTFSMSILIVYISNNLFFPVESWLLFITNIIWIIIYDTQYATTDMKYDIIISIKSTAILFGKKNRKIILYFQCLMIFSLIYIGYYLKLNYIFFIHLIIAGLIFLYQQKLMKKNNQNAYLKAFKSNQYVGLIIFIGIFLNFL